MMRRVSRSVAIAILAFLTAISLLLGFRYLSTSYGFRLSPGLSTGFTPGEMTEEPKPVEPEPVFKQGNETLFEMTPKYIAAIMDPEDDSFPRLKCPQPDSDRYDYLKTNEANPAERKFFFALDLHDCANLLPRLLGSVLEAMRFLGPQNCALSVIEGRSVDGTFEILERLRAEIEGIGAAYFFSTNELHPKGEGQDRIKLLAELRNLALEPMRRDPAQYAPDSKVVFLNDVAICMEDILELIHQQSKQDATMVCAMDWTYVGRDPTFYDVWIARDMKGDSFFNIPAPDNWNSAWNLFWNNPDTLSRYRDHKPFQTFSCWNGAVVFTAKPILENQISFRASSEGECHQGEPQLFCKDLWHLGLRKIAVIPSVNLEYSDERAQQIKDLKGYVSANVQNEDSSALINWDPNPPALVRCLASYPGEWGPWNETLV